MTAQQKIDRLMARVGRLQAQVQATANATAYAQADADQAAAMANLASLPNVVTTAMVDFEESLSKEVIAAFEASIAPVFDAAPAKRSYYSYFASSCSRAVAAVKAVVVGAGSAVKKAAVAVTWTAPKWLITTTVKSAVAVGSAIYSGVKPNAKMFLEFLGGVVLVMAPALLFAVVASAVVAAVIAVGAILASDLGLFFLVVGVGLSLYACMRAAELSITDAEMAAYGTSV